MSRVMTVLTLIVSPSAFVLLLDHIIHWLVSLSESSGLLRIQQVLEPDCK